MPSRHTTRNDLTVLLLEDDAPTAIGMIDSLASCGCPIVTYCSTVEDAKDAFTRARFDLGIIDIRIGEGTSQPIVEMAIEEKFPIILTTGYNLDFRFPRLPDAYVVLQKPVLDEQLEDAILHLTGLKHPSDA